MPKKFSRKQKRVLAVVLAAAMAVSALAIGLGSTLAAKPPVTGDFTQQPNLAHRPVEAGISTTVTVGGAAYARSSDANIFTTPGGRLSSPQVSVTGVNAGTAVISVGSIAGLVGSITIQVWDNRNIVKYSIANGAEVFFSRPDGSTKASPVTIETGIDYTSATPSVKAAANAAAFDAITWQSLQPEIAVVDVDGSITANSNNRKGAAIILGTFTDKWGNRQTMNILVGVETSLGNTNIDDLLKALAKAKEIEDDADENPDKYIESGLDELLKAAEAGEAVLADPNSTDSDYQQAADNIWDAILELQRRLRKNRLEDAIRWGEEILDAAEAGDVNYDEDLLQELEDAIEAGKLVLDDPDATDDECNAAADAILEVIKKMVEDGGKGDIVQGDDGNWYRRLGRPPNVYELLDDDKNSTYPPEYVYNDGDKPGNDRDRPVYGPRGGIFYVEDPEGSNIYKPIDGNGNISDDDAIWGGPNGEFGADDNRPAVKGEKTGKWYAYFGQNIYQEIDSNPSSANYGNLTGQKFGAGDSDDGPDTDTPLVPIYEHPWDGKYYAGPFGANNGPFGIYYIGDRRPPSGNGMVDTNGNGSGGHGNIAEYDQRWYMDRNGNMVEDRQTYNITSVTVDPPAVNVFQGGSHQFTARVEQFSTSPQLCNWEVIGAMSSGTVVNSQGLLAVAADELAATITVRAISVINPSVFGTSTVTIHESKPVLTEATVDKIASGRSTFLIKDNGTLWGAGLNGYGQLGVGDTRERRAYVPALVSPSNLTFKAVSTYTYSTTAHTLAIAMDGTLYTWGRNNYGQLGRGNTTQNSTNNSPQMTTLRGDVKFIAVSAGRFSSAAIDEDGRLYTWGRNTNHQLAQGTSSGNQTSPRLVNTTLRFRAVSAGDYFMYAITTDNKLYAWGYNNYGQLGQGDTTTMSIPQPVRVNGSYDTPIESVSCRSLEGHVIVLTKAGDLFACGRNNRGQLGIGNTTAQRWMVPVSTSLKFKAIATGHFHSMAVAMDGTLYAWGRNNYGQLGIGNTSNRSVPTPVSGNRKYVAMAAGEYTSMAVCDEGRLYLWGRNNYGQFGNGTTVNRNIPHFVPLA